MDENNKTNKTGFQYPMEVFTAKNTAQTLSVTSRLTQAKTSDEQAPLKMYHSSFALYNFSVVEKDAIVKAADCNLNVKELEDLFRRTDFAFQKQMEAEYCPPESVQPQPVTVPETNVNLPLPYTVTFPDGPYAGKSPADILLHVQDGKQVLNNFYKQLKSKADTSEQTALLLQAISEAARMSKDGTLKSVQKEVRADSPAYTVPLRNGIYVDGKQELKGCTPAAILSADPKNKSALLRQKGWLTGNLEKYPKNRVQIEAIDEAVRLFDQGMLLADTGNTATSDGQVPLPQKGGHATVRLYPPTENLIPKALTRNARPQDHKCPVHILEIYWHVGDRFPVEIRIMNEYCVVKMDEKKMIHPLLSTASDKVTKRMRLSEADWLNCIRSIKTDMRNFEMIYAKSARADAEQTDRMNRKKAAEQKQLDEAAKKEQSQKVVAVSSSVRAG